MTLVGILRDRARRTISVCVVALYKGHSNQDEDGDVTGRIRNDCTRMGHPRQVERHLHGLHFVILHRFPSPPCLDQQGSIFFHRMLPSLQIISK